MVYLRSGSKTSPLKTTDYTLTRLEGDTPAKKSSVRQIQHHAARTGNKVTSSSREGPEPSLKDIDASISFFQSKNVHTRADGSVPDISLSTEIPDAVVQNLERRLSRQEAGVRAAECVSSESESQNDSDNNDEDSLHELAASMLTALQKLNARQSGKSASTLELLNCKSRQSSGPGLLTEENSNPEGHWQPQTDISENSQGTARSEPEYEKLTKQLLVPPRDKKAEAKTRKASQPRDWHELPETPLTDEVKRDLRLLNLRGAMDPKRFYKRADDSKLPTKFAIGTIVEGPTDWYSGRIPKKLRKQSITEELLADHDLRDSRKRRFGNLQEEKSRWSHKKHKGSGERIKKKARGHRQH